MLAWLRDQNHLPGKKQQQMPPNPISLIWTKGWPEFSLQVKLFCQIKLGSLQAHKWASIFNEKTVELHLLEGHVKEHTSVCCVRNQCKSGSLYSLDVTRNLASEM